MRAKPYFQQRFCGLPNSKGEPCRKALPSGIYVCAAHSRTDEGRRVHKERRMAASAREETEHAEREARRLFLDHAATLGLGSDVTQASYVDWMAKRSEMESQ